MPVAHLYPRPPYDFSLSTVIFAGGDPQIRTYPDTESIISDMVKIRGVG